MSNDKIKVAGYAKKVFYNGGIEYRNFSPDLVGLQLTEQGGTPLFTMGNFSVTTNLEPKKSKNFTTKTFSNFTTLTSMDVDLQQTLELLINNAGVILNLDKRNLTNYALFNSFREFTRVALENIITNWPAALYVDPLYILATDTYTHSANTVTNYYYDNVANISYFKVNTNVINNIYNINFLKNQTSQPDTQANPLRNLTSTYESYAISYNDVEYDVLGFTAATNTINDYLKFAVKGNVFSGTTNGFQRYYIKPNKTKENLFFNGLENFEYYLLNRMVVPKYTAEFNYSIKAQSGDLVYTSEILTWPTTDGYNIDYETEQYIAYATKLLEISDNLDMTTTNLMVRFLVTESITDFDTTAVHLDPLDQDTSDQKVNKLLTIYGVEYDKLNLFITGVKFANTVTYDKNNNTPDIYLKNIARVLGWELVSSVLENDLLKSYVVPKKSSFSGQSIGLTLMEADIELWRRIILNTPWLWKSKGTRKGIEFLFKFIGTPLGLIRFNEYIYLAENTIDVDLFLQTLELNNNYVDEYTFTKYPVNPNDGYPNPLPNTSGLYFQSNGLWYRETGGENADIDITSGNNPHVGKYDGGYKYINQFRDLIPNFSAITVSSETTTTSTDNLFTNYVLGTVTGYNEPTYVDITNADGIDFSNCYVVKTTIIEDPKHRKDQTDCGCDVPENLKSLSICIEKKEIKQVNECDYVEYIRNLGYNYYTFSFNQYDEFGNLYLDTNGNPIYRKSYFINPTCCNITAGNGTSIPYHYNEVSGTGTFNDPYVIENSGYICCNPENRCGCLVTCKWVIAKSPNSVTIDRNQYLYFLDETGNYQVFTQDGSNCLAGYTRPIRLRDPNTQTIKFGCQLTQAGIADLQLSNSVIRQAYNDRASGKLGCCEEPTTIITPGGINVKFVAVVINIDEQSGLQPDIFAFESVEHPTGVFGNYNNIPAPLSAQTGTIQVGYLKTINSTTAPSYFGDKIRIMVAPGPNAAVTLPFITNTHSLGYLISNTEYNSTDFLTVQNNVIPVSDSRYTDSNNLSWISGEFILNQAPSQTTDTYVYLVYNYYQELIVTSGGGTGNIGCPQGSICACFVGDTLINMVDGEQTIIKNIKIGDVVMSYNITTNKIEPNKVLEIFNKSSEDLIKYTFQNGTTIISTDDHPFYVNGFNLASFNPIKTTKDYNLKTQQIKIGDIVNLSTDITTVIIDIQEYKEINEVYTFTVENNHNYYANNILVHNKLQAPKCCYSPSRNQYQSTYRIAGCCCLGSDWVDATGSGLC